MAINSKSEICNMTLELLGNYGTVSDIDLPTNDKEITFARWYDVVRQATLKLLMPNFALARKILSLVNETPVFGYAYAYEYPVDCLKLLGINNIDEKKFNYSVEGNRIYLDTLYPDGLPIRYVKDVTDVNAMTSDFKIELAFEIAPMVALPITQDANKAALVIKQLPAKRVALSALSAQENPPIRVSRSRFREARYSDPRRVPDKK